jgi:undecaprenyl-diphosphatase
MLTRIQEMFATLRQQGWWALIVLAFIGGALWGFAELADEVSDGETHAFDETVLLAFRTPGDLARPVGPEWLPYVARDLTAIGGATVLVMLTLAAIGYLLLRRKGGAAMFITASVLGGTLLSSLLKNVFERTRPDVVPHLMEATSASFPSGHSMLAMVTYLTLGSVLAEVHPNRRFKVYILSWAVFLSLLVGWSRIYLGVHWPTDVLGGWCLGSAWALGCGVVAVALQRRGVIEPSDKDKPTR